MITQRRQRPAARARIRRHALGALRPRSLLARCSPAAGIVHSEPRAGAALAGLPAVAPDPAWRCVRPSSSDDVFAERAGAHQKAIYGVPFQLMVASGRKGNADDSDALHGHDTPV